MDEPTVVLTLPMGEAKRLSKHLATYGGMAGTRERLARGIEGARPARLDSEPTGFGAIVYDEEGRLWVSIPSIKADRDQAWRSIVDGKAVAQYWDDAEFWPCELARPGWRPDA